VLHLSQNASTTSDTILFFDELFDSFNKNNKQGKVYYLLIKNTYLNNENKLYIVKLIFFLGLTSIITNTSNHTQFGRTHAINFVR